MTAVNVSAVSNTVVVTENGSSTVVTVPVTSVVTATATGPQGATGEQGPAATISIGTVTTGAPGSSVIVTNAGTTGAAILDFTIPAGADGATGSTGPQGLQGDPGPPGATGATGVAGADGVNGGFKYVYNSANTNTNPGTGKFIIERGATFTTSTFFDINWTSDSGVNLSTTIDSWDDSTTTNARGYLVVSSEDLSQQAIWIITGAVANFSSYRRFSISWQGGATSLNNGDTYYIAFYRTGNKGDTGPAPDLSALEARVAALESVNYLVLQDGN